MVMVSLQLFAIVFALSFWDGRALECAYKEKSPAFCKHVNESYQLNNSSQHLLGGATFKEDRGRISRANEKVLAVLKLNDKSELKTALCGALDSETHAVFNAGASCSGSEKETDACNLGLASLCLATEELVKASVEITEQDKKEQITKALNDYAVKEDKKNRVEWVELANGLGRNVSHILQC
ncbi:unnamed protein product [Nippostrongylus brasiliensis]|uniref:DUF725 domain-containing protein n=1 Tax=Nippostrongylus brasiliensis TaxID=27835 RepID=A0A0N4YIU4_NIPBR|nr:unnamed protein product [Nippostrongylus brasiliensis]